MSTIKVDTYLTRGGASEIAIDKLKGVTAAGSMLVVAEGGTNTTNLQQGLAKAWTNVNMPSASINDSYNVGSITDNSAGNFTVTFSSSMANANYSNAGSTIAGYIGGHASLATGSFILRNGDSNWSAVDQDTACVTTSGDLA